MGQGIRAKAREELKRQSALRQDSTAALAQLEALVGELREIELPAALKLLPVQYREATLTAVLVLPPIHPEESGAIPAWPDKIQAMAGYSVTFDPSNGFVDIEGPLALLPDGSPDSEDEDDRRDPAYLERFKTKGEGGYKKLSDFVARVRELAIVREMSLQAVEGAPAP